MHVIDNIAYAGEPEKIISAKSVRPLEEHRLLITFDTGERKIFDCKPLLELPCFLPLKDKSVFDKVYVDYGTVCWNDGEIDIAPERIYEEGTAPDSRSGL